MNRKDERTIVIGSNSFSGSSFVDHLLNQGEDVVGISRSPEPNDVFLKYKWRLPLNKFQFYQYDVNSNFNEITQLLEQLKPKKIVNFAAQSMVSQSWDAPEDWFMTNCVSSVKLQNHLRKSDWMEKYIHVSTPEVYGSTEGPVTEDNGFNPSTPYAVSRAAGDMSIMSFVNSFNFPAVITRAANVYGPGQSLYRIIPRTILSILTGESLNLHGGGKSERSFIHIDDVSRATEEILRQGINGATYHISTNRMISIKSLVELICNMMKIPFEEVVKISEDRAGKDQSYELDSKKLRYELNWSDQITLENGIDDTLSWVRDNLQVIKLQPREYIHRR